jgi:hypothetical protein
MKFNLITYIILFIISTTLIGQNNYIKNVKINSVNYEISLEPQLHNFLNDDILSAVNSGMNITFHFYIELHDSENKVLKEQDSQINVRNDIWENQYILSGYNLSKKFKEFERFKNFLLDSISFIINSTNNIPENKNLQLLLTFSPQKISTSQKKKLQNWLKNEEEDSESSISLNLTKLISFFLSEEKKENISIFRSDFFTKKSITVNEDSSK